MQYIDISSYNYVRKCCQWHYTALRDILFFLQQKDEQGFEYIGGSIANGFYGFIGSSFRKSKFLFRAMEHFAARVCWIDYDFVHIVLNRHRKIKMINNNVQSLFKFNNKLWESGGSTVFTKTLREYCQIPNSHKGQITGILLD